MTTGPVRSSRLPQAAGLILLLTPAANATQAVEAVPPPERMEASMDDPIRSVLEAVDPDVRVFDEHLTFLANPFLGGRLPGTQGMEIAKDYCEHYLELAGLEPGFVDEEGLPTWRQPFELATRRTLEGQSLSIGDAAFDPESDYQVVSLGEPGSVRAPVTFAGYGIDRGRDGYSSFEEGDDLSGQIAMVLRFEPMDESGNSLWSTGRSPWSARASFRRKLQDTAELGAAGILIVNTPGANDPRTEELGGFSLGRANVEVPVAMISADAAQRILDAGGAGLDLGALVAQANAGRVLQPVDAEVELHSDILSTPTIGENVGGLLRGRGELADELIVIGAHLDHLGLGSFGSRDTSENRGNRVHPGADDNATGSAALLMLADRLYRDYNDNLPEAASARSILIVLFSGEESGLNGSMAYVSDPIVPLDQHALMMNFDMIGRLEGNRMNVSGADTGVGMEAWAQPFFDSSPLEIVDTFGSRGGSDHLAFLQKKIPVLFGICAELHDDYHTSRDTAARINRVGSVAAMRLWHSLALSASLRPARFEFLDPNAAPEPEAAEEPTPAGGPGTVGEGRPSVRLGIQPGYADEGDGVLVEQVSPDTSASNAGLQAGDRILTWGDEPIEGAGDLMGRLRDHEPGDRVRVTVRREGQTDPISIDIELFAAEG